MWSQSAYQRMRAERLHEAGLCVICGKVPTAEGRRTCAICSAKQNARKDALRQKALETGICIKCGENPARKGKQMCPMCAFNESERVLEYYRRKRAEKAEVRA